MRFEAVLRLAEPTHRPGDRPCAPGAGGQVDRFRFAIPLPRSRPDPWRAVFKYAQVVRKGGRLLFHTDTISPVSRAAPATH